MAGSRGAYVGIDSAKARNAMAIADEVRHGEAGYLGEFDATPESMRRLVAGLGAKYDCSRVTAASANGRRIAFTVALRAEMSTLRGSTDLHLGRTTSGGGRNCLLRTTQYRVRHVPHGVYARAGARTNQGEARAIVAEVLALLRRALAGGRQRSVGIVTSNAEQQPDNRPPPGSPGRRVQGPLDSKSSTVPGPGSPEWLHPAGSSYRRHAARMSTPPS